MDGGLGVAGWFGARPVFQSPVVDGVATVHPRLGGVLVVPSATRTVAGQRWVERAIWWLGRHGREGVPRLIDYGGLSSESPWMVQSEAPGQSLLHVLWEDGPLSTVGAVRAIVALARVLAPYHARGWAHQALSLDLVYQTADGTTTVTGWGDVVTTRAQGQAVLPGATLDVGLMAKMCLELVSDDSVVLLRNGMVHDAISLAVEGNSEEVYALRAILARALHVHHEKRWENAGVFSTALTDWLRQVG